MHKKNVPQWFIDSCLKIKYLFPKPHAAAYAQTSYRIAYFKVYYPLQFYATYFSIKASDFDGDLAVLGADAIKKRFLDVKSAGKTATAKDQDMQPHLETAYEMYCEGIAFIRWILSFPMPPTMSLKMTASGSLQRTAGCGCSGGRIYLSSQAGGSFYVGGRPAQEV